MCFIGLKWANYVHDCPKQSSLFVGTRNLYHYTDCCVCLPRTVCSMLMQHFYTYTNCIFPFSLLKDGADGEGGGKSHLE